MNTFKIFPVLLLVTLWGALGWILQHRKSVRKELIDDEAIPRPAPRALLIVVLTTVVIALSVLLIYMIVS